VGASTWVRSAVPGGESQGPACASIPPDGAGSLVGMASVPAVTAAANNPELTTLASAFGAAGLTDTLNGPGPFTIFAPNNAAFAKIPPADLDFILADTALLTDILTFHMVSGQDLSVAELAAAAGVASIQGGELTFTTNADGLLSINGGATTDVCSEHPCRQRDHQRRRERVVSNARGHASYEVIE